MSTKHFSGPQLQSGQRGAAFSTLEVNDSLISGNSAQIGAGIGVGYFDGWRWQSSMHGTGVSRPMASRRALITPFRVVFRPRSPGNSAFLPGWWDLSSLSGPELLWAGIGIHRGRGLYVTSSAGLQFGSLLKLPLLIMWLALAPSARHSFDCFDGRAGFDKLWILHVRRMAFLFVWNRTVESSSSKSGRKQDGVEGQSEALQAI